MERISIQTIVSNMFDVLPNKCLNCTGLFLCSLCYMDNCLNESFSENENNDGDLQPF